MLTRSHPLAPRATRNRTRLLRHLFHLIVRVCFVEGRGTYRKADKHCPTLEQNSNIECIIGLDRLDCLRRIHKGTAHFGVFSSEDLVTARWAGVEVLVTSEMRFHNSECGLTNKCGEQY